MPYIGTPPRSRVLSSADIDPGSVSLDDISFTDQPASMNISGNIDKHTMRLADQVVVNGDLDITDNLILSKISDDGNAITLTNDSSTRTITGTGSLEASTLTQTPNASLTGMTGTIGSAVTFPAGHIIQTVYDTYATETNTGAGTAWVNTELAVAITPTATSSKILITYSLPTSVNTTSYQAVTSVFRGNVSGTNLGHADYGTAFHGTSHTNVTHSAIVVDTPSTTSATTYTIGIRETSDNQTYYCSNNSRATIVVQELAG